MKAVPLRIQLILVAAGYVAVLAIAALMLFVRHMQYVNHPEEVAAASGMYAGGDLILEIFIGCMLLVPTFFLVLVIRNSEALYKRVFTDPARPEPHRAALPGSIEYSRC